MNNSSKNIELSDNPHPFIKWGKIITRITAIGATITGAVAALFSSSSTVSGVALTAAGASTLAAAEKIPDNKYIRTKHIPPKRIGHSLQRSVLQPDILPQPEKITDAKKPHRQAKAQKHVMRPVASYETTRND